jgi:hypothetical protein
MESIRAYEFYYHDHIDQPQLIGILPERRKDLHRISAESIMNWAKKLLGDDWDMNRINFIEVTIDKMTGKIQESSGLPQYQQKTKID